MCKFRDLFKIKIKIGQNIDLVDNQRVTHLEDQRIFQGLVMSLRDRKDHGVFGSAGVKLRRAYKITHIFKHHKVKTLRAEFPQALSGHARIQVAHAAGMKLNDSCPGLRDLIGVNVGVYVRLHDADAHFLFELLDRPGQCGGLTASGRRHQVQ